MTHENNIAWAFAIAGSSIFMDRRALVSQNSRIFQRSNHINGSKYLVQCPISSDIFSSNTISSGFYGIRCSFYDLGNLP